MLCPTTEIFASINVSVNVAISQIIKHFKFAHLNSNSTHLYSKRIKPTFLFLLTVFLFRRVTAIQEMYHGYVCV